MNMGTNSSDAVNRISIDGVTYDVSNLVLKSNGSATREQKIYPTHLLSLKDDDEIVFNDSHDHRNSATKQRSLHASGDLGLDNVFNNSSHHRRDEYSSARSSNHSMHDSHMSSSRVNEGSLRGSYDSTQSRQRRMLSYSPDDDDDDSVCGGQDPARNSFSSPAASPRGKVNKSSPSSSYQTDAWGQHIPLKTPYDDGAGVTAQSTTGTAASSDKLAQFLQYNQKNNNDSDTSMGVESLMIEIMPGMSEPLRGSAETIKAHMSGDIMRVHCVCCDQDISCVGDAAYVLCPNCTVVSPAPSESMNGRSSWGVGLGFLADQFQVDDGRLSRSSSAVDPAYTSNY